VIPYTTFPRLDLGITTMDTFGVLAALGVVVGLLVTVRYASRVGRIPASTVGVVGAKVVLAGFVGARLSWVLTNLDLLSSWRDVVAVGEGGLQFSGGFIGAVLTAVVILRRLPRAQRWALADGLALGLVPGLALGRVGCLAVGEHIGPRSSFPLALRYEGGALREPTIDGIAIVPGTSFHHTSLYELMFLSALCVVLWVVTRRRRSGGSLIGLVGVAYGTGRFLLDFLRVNDERLLGLTGAQYLMIAVAIVGAAVLCRTSSRDHVAG